MKNQRNKKSAITKKKVKKKIPIKKSKNQMSKIKKKTSLPKISVDKKESKKEVTLSDKEKASLKLTESKIKKLLDVAHIEELLYMIHLLNEKQAAKFIEHYKQSEIKSEDRKIDGIIRKSNDLKELLNYLNEELVNSLKDEHEKIKEKMHFLRKKGFDVYIEDIRLMAIPLKIDLFKATMNKDDFYKIKKSLSDIKEELSKIEATIENPKQAKKD